ncbi:MAG: hypothetical protein IKL08_01635, partial [Clostridia bacterium]|nr:hypothetical protein [Clostridia bacterium]
ANDKEGLYEKRQTRYEILNDLPYMTKEKLIKEEKKLPAYNKDDYRFEEPDLNYYKKADDLLSEYGWIDRYGEWYSCDFGGHQCKAQTIVTGNGKILKDYYQWLQQEGKHVEKQSNFADGKQYSYKE